MRFGLDLTLLRAGRFSGVERHALSLVRELAALAPGEVVLFRRRDAPGDMGGLPVEQHLAPPASRPVVDQLWLPAAARRARVDFLHSLAFPTPLLWRGPSLLTVHDATPWLHRDALSPGMRLYHRPLFPQALRRAAAVLTVSEAARRDLAGATGVPAARIHVTPNGVDPRFFQSRAGAAPGERPYLLAVGTLEPRKDLPVLLDALRLLRRDGRDLRLVLAGRPGWGGALDPGDLRPQVRLAGPVADAELAALYAGAACYVLPSRYEGFGLPLLEAMASGTPAVASDIPALRELGGDAVRYAPPGDPAAFARAIASALDEPASEALAGAARKRARRFTWRVCAEATLRVYRSLAR